MTFLASYRRKLHSLKYFLHDFLGRLIVQLQYQSSRVRAFDATHAQYLSNGTAGTKKLIKLIIIIIRLGH